MTSKELSPAGKPQIQTEIEDTFRFLVPYSVGPGLPMERMEAPLRWHEQRWEHERDMGPRELSVWGRMNPRGERHLDLTRVMRGDPDEPSTDSHLWRFSIREPGTPQDTSKAFEVGTHITVTKTGEVTAERSTYEKTGEGHYRHLDTEYSDEMSAARLQELCSYASSVLTEARVVLPGMQEAFTEILPEYDQTPVGVDFAAHASQESVAAIYGL